MIVQFKSQKVWSRSINICGDGEGKNPAEIGLNLDLLGSVHKYFDWNTSLH